MHCLVREGVICTKHLQDLPLSKTCLVIVAVHWMAGAHKQTGLLCPAAWQLPAISSLPDIEQHFAALLYECRWRRWRRSIQVCKEQSWWSCNP